MKRKRATTAARESRRASAVARGPAGAAVAEEALWADAPAPALGYVDTFGYSSAAGGWFFNGWVPRPATPDRPEPVEFLAQYEKSQCWGRATLAFYRREDLDQKSMGVIAFVPSSSQVVGALQYIAFSLDGAKYQAQNGHFTNRLLDQDIVDRVRLNLTHQALATRAREHLLAITSRRGFTGQDTLGALSEPVFLELDEVLLCPPAGLLLKGWQLSAPGMVRSIRVRSGPLAGELERAAMIRVPRPDVLAAVGAQHGFSELRCGFIAYVPGVVSSGDAVYLEVELANGDVGFKPVTVSKRAGLDAIRHALDGVDVRSNELDAAFDKTWGPAISAINQARLQQPVRFTELGFGVPPAEVQCTVIVPLYRRIDFAEYQMALFSPAWDPARFELLYVLDDPDKHEELEALARSLYERFRIPFRVLLLQNNLGFAAANNVGLRTARGHYVCFLNSDVFPITPDWLDRLMAALEQNPDIGLVGARLLFEDGSVQHEGCEYRALPEHANWQFIEHVNKGRRPDASDDLRPWPVITGACMLLEQSLAHELGGFDEQFIVGDFEDSDLCLKAQARGRGAAVHLGVRLYHLERKSQDSPNERWRRNLTLYNAWVHQRRWFSAAGTLTFGEPS